MWVVNTHFFMKGDILYSSIVEQITDYGKISCNLKQILKEKQMTIYKLSNISNIKYEIIKKYCDNNIQRIDLDILAKLCFCLNLEVDSLLKYEKK